MKQKEEKCCKIEGIYRSAFESCVDALWFCQMDGVIIDANSACCRMFGYSHEELVKMQSKELISDEAVRDFEDFHSQVKSSGKVRLPSVGLCKDGNTFDIEIRYSVFMWDQKETFLYFVRDITERRQSEKTIEKTNAELTKVNDLLKMQNHALNRSRKEVLLTMKHVNQNAKKAMEATQAKSDFLASMSHEIRTPMNSIIGFTDILLDENTNPKKHEYLQAIRDAGVNLQTLINDILDFSKIEAGKLNLDIIPTPVDELFDEIYTMMLPMAETKELELKVTCDESLGKTIYTDPVRLRQCLLNLVNNAIKFTEKGYVHLNASLKDTGEKSWIRFDVIDTGIGIATDKQEDIFRDFSQAQEDITRKFGGTGLGLAISKKLVNLLGGQISVVSTFGKGATFTIKLPLITKKDKPTSIKDEIMERDIDGQHKNRQRPDKLSGRVLVAEDNPSNQMLVKILLEKIGMEVTLVADGSEAVELVNCEAFDVILMDMQMPKMNGYEATRLLREKGMDIPIIALTANAMKGDKEKCLEAGCNDYLAKPLQKGLFLEMLSKYLVKTEKSNDSDDTVYDEETDISLNDSAAMTSNISGDASLQPVINVFMEELPELIAQITDACQELDFELLKGLAHQLKGASGSAGFMVLSKYVSNVEVMVANEDIEKTKKAIDELDKFCKKVVETQNS